MTAHFCRTLAIHAFGGSAKRRKTHVERLKGTVKWFNNAKGYGFLGRDDGPDIFVHYSAITTEGYRSLQKGDKVEFEIVQGQKGPQAANVSKGSLSRRLFSCNCERQTQLSLAGSPHPFFRSALALLE